jgi:Asp/Glu/hydantoin racemase
MILSISCRGDPVVRAARADARPGRLGAAQTSITTGMIMGRRR